ncbi:MAG: heavy metal translocating P-type ATPase [Candidatus Merdivicinus sp.]|jgi:Cd2+/Zn2+-exporting ATPase
MSEKQNDKNQDISSACCSKQEHSHEHNGCSCQHDHSHDHSSCSCNHKHSHEHNACSNHQEHSHDHNSCSCAACSNEEKNIGNREYIVLGISILLTVLSFAIPEGIWRTLILAAAAILVGWQMFWEGIRGLFRLSLDEMTLMTIAVIAAFAIGEGFEGAMVTILFHIGEYIENRAVQTGRKRIDALLSIVPETANCIQMDGTAKTVSAKQVNVGDTILIRAGERVPLDCEVLSGTGEVDTSAVTGESQPISAEPGKKLLSGMINLTGALTCRTVQDYENSTASKIAQMVQEATAQKGKTERFITRFSRIYTPVVVIFAILLAVLPPILGAGTFSMWLHRALIFLVASCPCALVISIPMTFYNVISAASRSGSLIKGSKHIEAIAKIRQIVFDKTGTLTTGKLEVTDITSAGVHSTEEILRLAAICEAGSVHPIAQAVREKAGTIPHPDYAEDIPGKGVRASIQGTVYLCGSARLMQENGISLENLPEASLYLATPQQILGCIQTGDALRPEAKTALESLKKLGVSRTVMLTGDRRQSAEIVQKQLNLTEVRAELLPQDKVAAMENLRQNIPTAFVGDGINDGPVLAASDIGFAMGMGSDLAAQAADVILMSNNLTAIPKTISAARKGLRVARQNLIFILVIKGLVLLLGAIGIAPMWSAVFADVGVCILTVLNAMRAGNLSK